MAKTVNILVVDDEQIVLDSVVKHLRADDYSVRTVPSVRAALELLDQQKFEIVVTDLMMPRVDGLEFIRIIKERFPDILVIMMTGYATISSAGQATQQGAFAYVAKPFTRAELQEVVGRAADQVRGE